MPTIVTLPGDGIGPEVLGRRSRVLRAVAGDLDYEEHLFGGASIDAHGTALTDEMLAACRGVRRRAARRGRRPEVGHHRPGRAAARAGPARPAQGPRPLRQPAPGAPDPGAARRQPAASASSSRAPTCSSCASSPAASTSATQAAHGRPPPTTLCEYTEAEIERIARIAFERRPLARSRASTRRTCSRRRRLWREVVARVHAEEFPDVELEHLLVDNAAMQLVAAPAPLRRDPHREHVRRHPQRRGGDAHRLARACCRAPRWAATGPACSSPCTARRPTSPGTGTANPLAMFLSVAMMLRHGLAREEAAAAVESAVDQALERGPPHRGPGRERDDRGGHRGGPRDL